MSGDCGDLLAEVRASMDTAARRYGPFASAHEGFGVLAEEVSELLSAIHANALESIRHESIQVAAVALRLASYCRDDAAFRERSGR